MELIYVYGVLAIIFLCFYDRDVEKNYYNRYGSSLNNGLISYINDRFKISLYVFLILFLIEVFFRILDLFK